MNLGTVDQILQISGILFRHAVLICLASLLGVPLGIHCKHLVDLANGQFQFMESGCIVVGIMVIVAGVIVIGTIVVCVQCSWSHD